MQADRVPSRAPAPSDVYRAYVAVLPKWLRRFGVARPDDVAELMQEVWLAVCSGSVPLPNDIRDARLELFKITRLVAQRLRRAQTREGHLFVPDLDHRANDPDVPMRRHEPRLTNDVDEEKLAALTLGVFEAFERLSPKDQKLAREYYVFGYTIKEMAKLADVPEDRMEKWVWRMRAELEKLTQADERLEHRNKKRRNRAVVVPFAFDLDPATRAAFCSIWEAEEGPAEFGGGSGGAPPSIPPVFPVSPILLGAAGSAIAAMGLAIVVVILASLGAIHYFWKPPQVETAQTGLRVPPLPEVGAIDDVVPVYPLPVVPRALPPVARPARKSIPVQDEPSSGPAFERGASD